MEDCKRVMLERKLERAGFKLERKMRNSNSVVAPAFGLCSYAALYTDNDNLDDIASSLRNTEGVDFSVYRGNSSNRLVVEGAGGRASVEFDDSRNAYRYSCESGDPLGLNPAIEKIRKRGEVG